MHFTNDRTFQIPGRGLALSWAPRGSAVAGGHALAVGGHLVGAQAFVLGGERYDTKLFDTRSGAYLKRFGVHYWWTVSNAWTMNPYLGEVIADGAGDHAVKLFRADGPGTQLGPFQSSDARGRYALADGALAAVKAVHGNGAPGLPDINGWVTSLDFSPDGRFLAGASRDRTIRIWQIASDVHPEDQMKVVKVYYDPNIGNYLSVRWARDGRSFATGEHEGRVAIFRFDPERSRWDAATINEFFGVAWRDELAWLQTHAALVGDVPVWQRTGLGPVWNVRYSPDGRWLAAAGGNGAAVYDLAANGAARGLVAKADGLDWSPDGRFLAVGGTDGHVYVYGAQSSPPFATYDVLQAHTEPSVGAVAWSPDASTLATSAGGPLLGGADFNLSVEGADDTVRLWRPAESAGVECTGTPSPPGPPPTLPPPGPPPTLPPPGPPPTLPPPGGGPGPDGSYPGFGNATTGGAGHAVITVTTDVDSGPGSFRGALTQAGKAGGAVIRFAPGASFDLHPGSPLAVPPNTTVDATAAHVTLWGGKEGGGDGLLDLWESNVIVVGLRIRNAVNDGIQISPKNGHDIARIVVDRSSITGSADGGIDVTGHSHRTVTDVTLIRNYIAGSGRLCSKAGAKTGPCGGGSLLKYGASRVSYYANFFDDNLERTPLVSGSGSPVPVVADVRWNATRGTTHSAISVRQGASANIVGNFFLAAFEGARVWSGGHAFFGGGNVDTNPNPPSDGHIAELPVPAAPAPFSRGQALGAGAPPRDAVDTCYVGLPFHTFWAFHAASCARVVGAPT